MARVGVDVWFVLLILFGLGSAVNGVWMLTDSLGWFERWAADVTPFNVHFVRDVGAAYFTAGAALYRQRPGAAQGGIAPCRGRAGRPDRA